MGLVDGKLEQGGLLNYSSIVSVIDGFEDGDISEYIGDNSEFSVQQSTVFDGTYALKLDLQVASANIRSTSGLDNYPEVGVKNQHRVRLESTVGDPAWFNSWMTEGNSFQNNNSYGYTLWGYGELEIWKDGYQTILASSTGNADILDEWMRVEILHEADGSITVEVYHESDQTLHSSVTATDDSYITSGSFDHTGIMFRSGRTDEIHYADLWEIK